eukprot:1576341-Prymnesium_polylepis.1
MLPYAGGADHMAVTSGGRAVGATSEAKMGNKCQALRSLAVTAIECVLPTVPELGSIPSVRILYTAITEHMGAQFYQDYDEFDEATGRFKGASAATLYAEVRRMGAASASKATMVLHFHCSGCGGFHTSAWSSGSQKNTFLFSALLCCPLGFESDKSSPTPGNIWQENLEFGWSTPQLKWIRLHSYGSRQHPSILASDWHIHSRLLHQVSQPSPAVRAEKYFGSKYRR